MQNSSTPHVPHYAQWTMVCFVYLLGVLTYGVFYQDAVFLDGDSPWHLAAGDLIRSLERVPDHDPWAYTNEGVRWYNISWLYDVVISALQEALGMKGLLAVNVLVAALTPALLARISFQNGAGAIAVLLSSCIALIMLKACVALRPQQSALLLVALMYGCLCRYRLAQGKRIWWLPVLTMLLVNIHGSFLVVFVMIGAFWLDALIGKDWPRVRTLTQVGIACALATLANPYFYQIYYASWLTLSSEIGKQYISEWQPAGLTTHPHIYLYALIVLATPYFLAIKLRLAEKLLLIFWVLMALNSARYNVVLALFITPFLALVLSGACGNMAKCRKAESNINADLNHKSAAKAVAIAGVLAALFVLLPHTRNLVWSKELYDPEKYPVEEIAYLLKEAGDARIMNHYNYGGYLIYQSGGKLKPFVDGRADTAYSKEFLRDYADIERFNAGWEKLLEKYDVQYILLPNDHKNIEFVSESGRWKLMFEGRVASVYRKS